VAAGTLKGEIRQARPVLRLPRNRQLALEVTPLVMGILNVTPDSFSDGGEYFQHEAAIEAALRMIDDGADLIDIGGESTRPGAEPVSATDELNRVLPVIAAIREKSDVPISIDTMKATVAEAALAEGADIVNDVSAMRMDAAMAGVVARLDVPLILMHMRGEPRTMQGDTHYDDLLSEVMGYLRDRKAVAVAAGIDSSQVLVDPGIGFGKSFDQNLELLHRADELSAIAPVVIGSSRKAFIGSLTGQPAGSFRLAGSLATVAAAAMAGAAMVRVHDVRPTVDFLRVLRAIERAVPR